MTPNPSLACVERQRLIGELLAESELLVRSESPAGSGRVPLAALQAEIDRRLRPLQSPQQAVDVLMPLLEARADMLVELAARLRRLGEAAGGMDGEARR